MNTEIKNALLAADKEAKYDESAKCLLSQGIKEAGIAEGEGRGEVRFSEIGAKVKSFIDRLIDD